MRPVLFKLPAPPVGTLLGILVVLGVMVGLWLLWQRRKRTYSLDQLYTGLSLFGMVAVILFILHHLGSLRVNSYGAMLMLGFIGGAFTSVRMGIRRGVPAERILDLTLFILFGAIVGARVAYVILTPGTPLLPDLKTVMSEGMGGLTFVGGLLGGIIVAAIYVVALRAKGIALKGWRVFDTLSPGLALGYAITRIGCFLNGCCYGEKCASLPWGVVFPNLQEGHVLRHPTQLYASLMGFTMFGILLLLSRGRSLGRAGRIFTVLLMLEGVERFVMEIFRQRAPGDTGVLTMAQLVSVLLFICGIIGWFLLPKTPAVEDTTALAAAEKASVK